MARAVLQKNFDGDLENALVVVRKGPPSTPQAGNVLVRITMCPIHPIDLVIIRTGELMKFKGVASVGSEGVGFVEAVGEGVTKFKVGQRVVPILFWKYLRGRGYGAWQDYVEVAEEDAEPVPDSVSDESASQYIINPWTAYGLLLDSGARQGEHVLLSAAGSAVGRQLIQIGKHWDFKIIAIVRRDELKAELKLLGAEEVINSTTEDVVARVRDITGGRGVYAALDGVGGKLTKALASSVRDGGKLLIYGTLGGYELTLGTMDLVRNVQISWWSLTVFLKNAEIFKKTTREVMKLMENKVLEPYAGKKFNLDDFKSAIKEAEKDARGGKVLLVT